MYCDVPGSPCLSKNGSNVRSVLFKKKFCRIPGPVSCRCLEPGWFVGDPTSLARDIILLSFRPNTNSPATCTDIKLNLFSTINI